VRGEQRWFAQCGFEATSATWLFPGETVRVDAPCLVTHDAGRVDPQDPAVPHLDGHRIAAVAARLQVVEFQND